MMNYMLCQNEHLIAQEWKKYKGYTVRPVASTELYYKRQIHYLPEKTRSLVYGGTPEIRSLFQAKKLPLDIVDRSEQTVRALGLLTEAAKPFADNENFILTDWLDVKLNQTYDLLIGDDAINMVAWAHFELFLQNAYRLLNKHGIFICHLLVKPNDEFIYQDINSVKQAYHSGSIASVYDLASRLNFICFNHADYTMGWQKTIAALGQDKLAEFLPDLDFIQTFGLCNSQFSCPPQDRFERLLEPYFLIEEIFYPHEHEYCLFEPVYLLRKKKND